MKFNLSIPALILAALTSACKLSAPEQPTGHVTSGSALLSQIADPPAPYRAAPLWDWNDKISKSEIDFQLRKFREGGLGGVFIHPRPGLVTEYLSQDWNELFQFTVQTAKKLGMQVWIYDENSYPSGFAGGHVQERYPDSYRNGTGLGVKIVRDLKEIADLPVEVLLKKSVKQLNSGEPPTYYVFYRTYPQKSWWYGGFPYVDLLYPGVTDTFMRATMEGYEKYNREEFGKTLPGIFTDEPNLEAAKGPETLIRWTPELFDEFENRFGYRLEPELVSLIEETDNFMKIRHDYYTLMLEMFLDRWAVPWFNYCEKNNLLWTGHYWEHGWPYPGDGIDESAFYMYHQMPGVDMLGRAYDSSGMAGQFGNTRAIRELASAANQSGWNRRLSETWGGAGWQISFAELKRLVDWEVVLGVNFVNPHLSYYSMLGVRKFDYPPSFSYQEPWWDNFSLLGDYIGRICLAMSAGEQVNNTLILQPNTTAWMYHSATKDDKRIFNLSVAFKKFLQNLEYDQYEYDLGSEQVLKRFGESTKKGIKIRNRVYDHLVLPPGMRNVESSTLNLIKSYLADGYTVMCLSDSIDYVDGHPDKSVHELAAKFPVNWINGLNPNSDHVKSYFTNPDFSLKQSDPASGQLFHQRRILDDGQLLFIINSDLEHPAEAEILIKGRNLTEIDLKDGLAESLPFVKKPGQISTTIMLPPGGSRLLLATLKPVTPRMRKNPPAETAIQIKPQGDLQVKRMAPNVLTLDYLDLETSSFKKDDMYFMTAMYKLFGLSGLKTGNPWQHKIQFRQQYLDLDTFTTDSWFKARYHFTIDPAAGKDSFKDLQAVVERPGLWQISLNGTVINPVEGAWWLDRQFPVFSIGNIVKPGENTIELAAPKMSVFAELMPVYILGDFSLDNSTAGFTIRPSYDPGLHAWKDKGMPFYGDRVSYSRVFPVDDASGTFRLKVSLWRGAVAEVWVNGRNAGCIGWEPCELDISSYIQKGNNLVDLRLTGSLKNTLGYHHVVQSGWIDSPFSWNQGPEKQPKGSDYQFLDYGLFKEFVLLRTGHSD